MHGPFTSCMKLVASLCDYNPTRYLRHSEDFPVEKSHPMSTSPPAGGKPSLCISQGALPYALVSSTGNRPLQKLQSPPRQALSFQITNPDLSPVSLNPAAEMLAFHLVSDESPPERLSRKHAGANACAVLQKRGPQISEQYWLQ